MPKSKEQFEKIKEERKKTIIDGAIFLFATKGYNSVTTDEITKHVNCSHGLLYHYFKNKEGLFYEVMENHVFPKIDEIIAPVNFDQKPKFVLQDILDAYLQALKSEDNAYACDLYLVLNLHLQKQLPAPPQRKNRRKKIYEYFEEVIELGKKQGDFVSCSTKEMVIAYLAMLQGLAYNRIFLGSKKFMCPKSDILMRMIIKKEVKHD